MQLITTGSQKARQKEHGKQHRPKYAHLLTGQAHVFLPHHRLPFTDDEKGKKNIHLALQQLYMVAVGKRVLIIYYVGPANSALIVGKT